MLAWILASLSCLVPVSNCIKEHFQLTFRVIAPSALILSSWCCLGSAYHRHLIFSALCSTALLMWLCSPGYWQACPAWCCIKILHQRASSVRAQLNSTFGTAAELHGTPNFSDGVKCMHSVNVCLQTGRPVLLGACNKSRQHCIQRTVRLTEPSQSVVRCDQHSS